MRYMKLGKKTEGSVKGRFVRLTGCPTGLHMRMSVNEEFG